MSIYVEILIRAPMDALWAHTQTPASDGGRSPQSHPPAASRTSRLSKPGIDLGEHRRERNQTDHARRGVRRPPLTQPRPERETASDLKQRGHDEGSQV
jgi:hypothetical protein